MAASTKTREKSSQSPNTGSVGKKAPVGFIIDLVVVVTAAVAAGLTLLLGPAAGPWLNETLALAWAPVTAFALGTVVMLRYWPKVLFRRWNWWLVAAGVTAIVVGAMSFFNPGYGIYAEVSLAGAWGAVLGGSPMWLGVVKLAAIAVALPPIAHPRLIGGGYLKGGRWTGAHAGSGGKKAGKGAYAAGKGLGRGLGSLFNGRNVRRWFRRNLRRRGNSGESVDHVPDVDPSDNLYTDQDWDPAQGLDELLGPQLAEDSDDESPALTPPVKSQWKLPSMSLLSPPELYAAPEEPLQEMARHIEQTLSDHGVNVQVEGIKAGPRIVQFGLVPGWVPRRGGDSRRKDGDEPMERSRVKVQNILSREKDLALALKTPYLRIEAPVPGEALVGLEVPNPSPAKVPLRQVMEDESFTRLTAKGGLPIAMGEDTGGGAVVMDLASLPHMLIAGATGSGKSVCTNTIVASLLFTNPPDQLRLLMVDPKRVELTPFNGIPHLVAPVIVDAEEVNPALRAMMREMTARYKLMEESGTRNIAGYNAKAQERMPYLVVIVDELADLMMAGGFEIEQNLVRLAQLGRAAGIHLVLATQRPSVNVVTGLLKANIPARAAFAVASQVDSRVILDSVGAEKLMGRGDMLLLNNDSPKPRRVQGTLVLDEEVDKVVEFWVNQEGPPLPVISLEEADEEVEAHNNIDAEMMDVARDLAIRNPHLTASYLERRLKIGNFKAEQIIELLEDEGLMIPD